MDDTMRRDETDCSANCETNCSSLQFENHLPPDRAYDTTTNEQTLSHEKGITQQCTSDIISAVKIVDINMTDILHVLKNETTAESTV
jgi:hypothetical protein